MNGRQLRVGESDIQLEYVRTFVLADTPAGDVILVDTKFKWTADDLITTLQHKFENNDHLTITYEGGTYYDGLGRVLEVFNRE